MRAVPTQAVRAKVLAARLMIERAGLGLMVTGWTAYSVRGAR
jgi:hypothetical protein